MSTSSDPHEASGIQRNSLNANTGVRKFSPALSLGWIFLPGFLFLLQEILYRDFSILDKLTSSIILFFFLFLAARFSAFSLQSKALRRASVLVIPSGNPHLYTLSQSLVLGLLTLILIPLVFPLEFIPRIILYVLAGLLILAGFILNPRRFSVQYWLKNLLILDRRIIPYESVEALILIPWQGFDIHLRNQQILEIRKNSQDASRLLSSLQAVLSPWGIKIR